LGINANKFPDVPAESRELEIIQVVELIDKRDDSYISISAFRMLLELTPMSSVVNGIGQVRSSMLFAGGDERLARIEDGGANLKSAFRE
jgi:hypothetical protein